MQRLVALRSLRIVRAPVSPRGPEPAAEAKGYGSAVASAGTRTSTCSADCGFRS